MWFDHVQRDCEMGARSTCIWSTNSWGRKLRYPLPPHIRSRTQTLTDPVCSRVGSWADKSDWYWFIMRKEYCWLADKSWLKPTSEHIPERRHSRKGRVLLRCTPARLVNRLLSRDSRPFKIVTWWGFLFYKHAFSLCSERNISKTEPHVVPGALHGDWWRVATASKFQRCHPQHRIPGRFQCQLSAVTLNTRRDYSSSIMNLW